MSSFWNMSGLVSSRWTSEADEQSLPVSSTDRGRLTNERMQRLQDAMTQLAAGLNALHAAGILHTDIKPSNVLMTTEGRLVLLDFGLAVPLDPKKGGSKLIQGTPRYMSPEQANAEPLTEASDWYSVGVMLYEVLTGRLPFSGNTLQILSKKRTESPIEPLQLSARQSETSQRPVFGPAGPRSGQASDGRGSPPVLSCLGCRRDDDRAEACGGASSRWN